MNNICAYLYLINVSSVIPNKDRMDRTSSGGANDESYFQILIGKYATEVGTGSGGVYNDKVDVIEAGCNYLSVGTRDRVCKTVIKKGV